MAAVPVDDHDFSPRSIPSFPFLEQVRNFRVDGAHPPTSNADGMDFERCSALHNAIIKHTWSATGHEPSDLPQTTWTQIEYNVPHLAEVESRLHLSVVEFLKRALAVSSFPDEPCENRFFYYCDDLSPAEIMFDDYGIYREDGANRITLYLAGSFKEEFRDVLVYVIHGT
ncbi:hypothetical protein MBLNU13_g06334t1 [Cladosporium sp. NU13]